MFNLALKKSTELNNKLESYHKFRGAASIKQCVARTNRPIMKIRLLTCYTS